MKKEKNSIISLNSAQQQAVDHIQGPLLIIAGAGSGKTRVITSRIIHLIQNHGVLSSQLVALTFTNKAANEMKERIQKALNSNNLPFIGTFHSYCLRLLKEYNHLLDIPFISILDEDDKKKMISGILHRHNLHKQIAPRQAGYHISQIKNRIINKSKAVNGFENPIMPDIYRAYEQEKHESKCLDFDDLLLEAVQLFKKSKEFKKEFQTTVRHVLVDEYQDTNVVQHELLKEMSLDKKKLAVDSICAVGDEDQSIYSWRGATVANILTYKKDFPGTKIVKIEQNYRSVQPILETANHVIKNNTQRNPKKLWSEREASNRVKVFTLLSEYQESDAIKHLVNVVRDNNKKETIAVLYRTHAQSRAIEEGLLRASIPYKIIGGIQFYERKEIKDLLAYLRLISNPFDRPSFFRVVNTPSRGLGAKFEELFFGRWKQEPFLTFEQVIEKLIEEKLIPPSKQKALEQFKSVVHGLSPSDKVSDALATIIKHSEYISHVKKSYEKEEAQTRVENIQELVEAVKHFEEQKIDTVTLFLDEVSLLQDKIAASDDKQEKVLLMTLHAAKGLEFDTVILAGVEEGTLPTSRALFDDQNALEEERRLFYVGITRAKERLLLTHAKYRYTYGKMEDKLPSQFLNELPSTDHHVVGFEDCSYWKAHDFRSYFAHWFDIRHESEIKQANKPASFTRRRELFKKILGKKVTHKPATKTTIRSTPTAKSTFASTGAWKKNQPVQHKKYGTGLIQKIETKNGGNVLTVKFKSGIKKIVEKFIDPI